MRIRKQKSGSTLSLVRDQYDRERKRSRYVTIGSISAFCPPDQISARLQLADGVSLTESEMAQLAAALAKNPRTPSPAELAVRWVTLCAQDAGDLEPHERRARYDALVQTCRDALLVLDDSAKPAQVAPATASPANGAGDRERPASVCGMRSLATRMATFARLVSIRAATLLSRPRTSNESRNSLR